MNYAKYEKLPVKLDESLKEASICMYQERNNNIHTNKCIDNHASTYISDYMLNSNSIDECKTIYNNRIINNVVSNKNNKQLANHLWKNINKSN